MSYEISDDMCLQTNTDIKIKERMVYLFYEMNRQCSPEDYDKLSREFGELLAHIKKNIRDFPAKRNHYLEYLLYLFKITLHVRDIREGKGERDVTYMLIYTWYTYYPMFAVNALPLVVQYGCWRDICGLCHYIKTHSEKEEHHPLIESCVEFMVRQLIEDTRGERPVSLAAKWTPREKRHNQWLFDMFVLHWTRQKCPYMLKTPNHLCAYDCAFNKCRMEFRKVVSTLTKKINIVEHKQCAGQWKDISTRDINLGTFVSRGDCFMNMKCGKERTYASLEKTCDRQQCSHKMQKIYQHGFAKSRRRRTISISGGLFSIPTGHFVKRAIQLLSHQEHARPHLKAALPSADAVDAPDTLYIEREIQLLNKQWIKYTKTCPNLPAIIPIIAMDFSESSDNIYHAIGLTCIIAEKSIICQRVMVAQSSEWISLEKCTDFVSMVQALYKYYREVHDEIDVADSFIKISRSFHHSNMSSEDIAQLGFVVFTDGSQTKLYEQSDQVLHAQISKPFSEYTEMPHFVYWNMSNSVSDVVGCPCSPTLGGTTVLSGKSPALLKHLQFLGLMSVRRLTPYHAMCNILDNDRYDVVEEVFMQILA